MLILGIFVFVNYMYTRRDHGVICYNICVALNGILRVDAVAVAIYFRPHEMHEPQAIAIDDPGRLSICMSVTQFCLANTAETD